MKTAAICPHCGGLVDVIHGLYDDPVGRALAKHYDDCPNNYTPEPV